MVGLIFHVLYLFGKCIYDRYYVRKTRLLPDTPNEAELFMPDYDTFDDVVELENTSWWTHHTINNFCPPAYIQRYCAVSNVLAEYKGKLHKIVDFGCAELGFLIYMKAISEVQEILCVDVDREVLERYERKASPLITEMLSSRERKLTIEICEGSVTDNDIKLKHANAVICIELIEHLYPDTLIDLPFNIFGYIKPEVAIITTPNVEFNVVFPNLSGYRHSDHKFEWTRKQFQDWAQNIVERYPYYSVTFHGIANGTEGTEEFGALTQMAVFHRILPRDQSRIEILIPDEYIRLKGQHNLFNTVAKYNYSTGSDSRTDEQKILDDAVYYIHFLSSNINDEFSDDSEIHLDRLLRFMDKYTLTIETLRSILTDAGWNIEDREEGPVLLPSSMHSDDEISEFDDYLNVDSDDWNNEYGNSEEEYDFVNRENTLDCVYYPSINEIPAEPSNEEYVPQQDILTENWNEEPNVMNEENRFDYVTNSSMNEMSMDANEEYLTEQNLDIESWHDNPNFTNEGDRWNYRSSVVVLNEIPADTNEEYSSAQDPHIENWHEESSIIIPENCSINQEYTYLFDGEHSLVGEDSCTIYNDIKHSGVRSTAESLAYTERELPSDSIPLTLNEVEVEAQETFFNMSSAAHNNTLQLKNSTDNIVIESAQDDQKDLRTMQGTSTLNFQYRPVSRSSTSPVSLYFSSEHLSLQDFSTSYQNGSSVNDQCSLNTTFHQSEIATEEAINSQVSIVEDISCSKENLLVKDTQKSFSLHMRPPNCNVDRRNISDGNQICEGGDMTDMVSPDAYGNILNDQPKYTSSPLTKISVINIVDKSLKKRELIPAMNSNVLLGTKEIKETMSDTDSNLLGTSQKSNSITETIKLNVTSSSSDVTNISRDVDFSASNSTLQRLCVEDKECSVNNSIPTNLIQDTNKEFVKNDIINHECDDIPNADAHDVLSLDSESINHKDKPVYSIPAKTNHIDVKAHLENLISDLAQSSIRKKGLNPPTELLSSKSQNVSKYSSYDCAKESSILKNNRFVSCKSSEDTSNVHFPSVLRSEENIGTSKDVSNIAGSANTVEAKSSSPLETPPSSWSPEIMDSGYPNSASAQDITPEYDLSSIAQDHIPDSESPSIAEAPRIGVLEPIEVENGDLANNNRDDEGNNMMAVDANDIENLQPFIDVLENDLENENDIYIMQNGFPVWLLRILDMANPIDFDIQARQDLRVPDEVADDANYVGQDEGFDSSSSESESDIAYNGMENNAHDE